LGLNKVVETRAFTWFVNAAPLTVYLVRSSVPESGMKPLRVVKLKILIQFASHFSDRTVVVEIYFFIFDRSPQAPDKDVVKDAAPAVYADGDPTSFQPVRELGAGELAALIWGVGDVVGKRDKLR
jgi:hypothetical protein